MHSLPGGSPARNDAENAPEPLLSWRVPVEPPTLPAPVASLLEGCAFVEIMRSYPAPSRVYHAARPGAPGHYLKVGSCLRRERDRLRWLRGRFPVAEVERYAERGGRGYLLMAELPGRPATSPDLAGDPDGVVRAVARAVRSLHSVPVDRCPFTAPAGRQLAAAARAVRLGRVRRPQLTWYYRHLEPEAILRRALSLRPPRERAVFTHGDCCLPNVLIPDHGPAAMVDLGMAGVSDPWCDLALMARSIQDNFGLRWVDAFFAEYGEAVDERRLEFFALVDELTMMRPPTPLPPGTGAP